MGAAGLPHCRKRPGAPHRDRAQALREGAPPPVMPSSMRSTPACFRSSRQPRCLWIPGHAPGAARSSRTLGALLGVAAVSVRSTAEIRNSHYRSTTYSHPRPHLELAAASQIGRSPGGCRSTSTQLHGNRDQPLMPCPLGHGARVKWRRVSPQHPVKPRRYSESRAARTEPEAAPHDTTAHPSTRPASHPSQCGHRRPRSRYASPRRTFRARRILQCLPVLTKQRDAPDGRCPLATRRPRRGSRDRGTK